MMQFAVPVENSLLFAQALRRHNISFELRICKDATASASRRKILTWPRGWICVRGGCAAEGGDWLTGSL